MPTPKPGQILCPTCHRATPMAAFCTQCGTALPASAHARPRGMDREELEERIRTRRPGEGGLRRGTSLHDDEPRAGAGYVPFVPEPEDVKAVREEEPVEPAPNVDHTRPGFDEPARTSAPASWATDDAMPYDNAAYQQAAWEDDPDAGYDAPAGGHPYVQRGSGDGRRPGVGALPVIGFILLCVLALGVGAALASALGGGIGQATSSPSPSESLVATSEPTAVPSESAPDEASATPEPTDGPVTFPDGTVIRVQPCASQEMSFDGCAEDGSVINEPTMWVWIGFEDARGTDVFVLTLRSEGQTIDQQEKELGSVVACPGSCTGYVIGAAYRDLEAGEYELVVRRGEDFADSASFTVEG